MKLPYQNMSFCKDFKDNSLIRSHNWGEVSILAPHLAVRCLIWTATASSDLRALQSQATQDRPIRIWRFLIRESVKPPPFSCFLSVGVCEGFALFANCSRFQRNGATFKIPLSSRAHSRITTLSPRTFIFFFTFTLTFSSCKSDHSSQYQIRVGSDGWRIEIPGLSISVLPCRCSSSSSSSWMEPVSSWCGRSIHDTPF